MARTPLASCVQDIALSRRRFIGAAGAAAASLAAWTPRARAEPELSGACHFAGEHTTQDFQGYLQGAVFSGNRAAAEVLDAL